MSQVTVTTKAQREIHDDIVWLQECVDPGEVLDKWGDDPPDWYAPGHTVHFTNNAFLLRDEQTLLFDTMSHASSDDVVDVVRSALAGDQLDYLLISHGEANHAANTHRLLDAFPEATLLAIEGESPEHGTFPLADAELVNWGDSIDLGRFEADIIEPAFPDTAMTVWLFESRTRTLFTVDWLGIPHTDNECGQFVDELQKPISVDRLAEFHGRALSWLEYANPDKTAERIDSLIEEYNPRSVAPAHGLVIREDATTHIRNVQRAIQEIVAKGSDAFHHPFD